MSTKPLILGIIFLWLVCMILLGAFGVRQADKWGLLPWPIEYDPDTSIEKPVP